MPCAAGRQCNMQHNTPAPPRYTCHMCQICGGYLHGICGIEDPLADSDLKRLCSLSCCRENGEGKGVPTLLRWFHPIPRDKASDGLSNGGGSSNTSESNQDKSNTPDGENGLPADTTPKGIWTRKRVRLSVSQKAEIIDLVQEKRVKHAVVAQKFGVAERTITRVMSQKSVIREARANIGGADVKKAIHQPRFPDVSYTGWHLSLLIVAYGTCSISSQDCPTACAVIVSDRTHVLVRVPCFNCRDTGLTAIASPCYIRGGHGLHAVTSLVIRYSAATVMLCYVEAQRSGVHRDVIP